MTGINFKKIFAVFLIFIITSIPSYGADKVNIKASMDDSFSLSNVPETVSFKTKEDIELPNGIKIPSNSTINADVFQYQKERRWHKSGFFICKPRSYEVVSGNKIYISNDDIYFILRRFENVNKKEATVLTVELVLMTGASIFAPGVDIGYFFVKGAIQRKNHPNWFKSGVSSAYENSLCWFWLKGKPIELLEGDTVTVKQIKKRKAEKLKLKIDKRHVKENLRNDLKNLKQEKKEFKKQKRRKSAA